MGPDIQRLLRAGAEHRPMGHREMATAKFAARLAFTERRLAALHGAIKTVTEIFDTLYASLSEEQKIRIGAGPRRWCWPKSERTQG